MKKKNYMPKTPKEKGLLVGAIICIVIFIPCLIFIMEGIGIIPFLIIDSSFTGLFFSLVEESILKILNVTEETVNVGDQSVSRIFKQINPLEKTKGFIGIFSTNVTIGFCMGYNKYFMIK